jgi:hypothetical protein
MTFSPVHNHWQGPPGVQEADRSQQLQMIQWPACRQLSCTCICCRVQDQIERMRGNFGKLVLRLVAPDAGIQVCHRMQVPQDLRQISTPSMMSDRSWVVISMTTVRGRRTGGCSLVRAVANVFRPEKCSEHRGWGTFVVSQESRCKCNSLLRLSQ